MNNSKYMDACSLYDALIKIYKEYLDEEYYKFESITEEYADMVVRETCQFMNDYVHMKDTSIYIYGNFNDIRVDYNREHDNDFDEIIKKIDNNQLSNEELEEFQEWALSWFFETFGPYSLKYNIGQFIFRT